MKHVLDQKYKVNKIEIQVGAKKITRITRCSYSHWENIQKEKCRGTCLNSKNNSSVDLIHFCFTTRSDEKGLICITLCTGFMKSTYKYSVMLFILLFS